MTSGRIGSLLSGSFCQCDVIGWCGCLGLFPGGHTIFCAPCNTEKVTENFGFTTHVCYANIVSKKERRKLTTTRHTTREKENGE